MPTTHAALDSLAGLALAYELAGRPREADAVLVQAREFARWRNHADELTLVGSSEARIALLRGDLDTACRWQRGLGGTRDLRAAISRTEVPAITECRVLAAMGDDAALREASAKLAQLRAQAQALDLVCQQVEIAPLEAVVLRRRGQTDLALRALVEALALASPGGWVRPYVELGTAVGELLEALPEDGGDRPLVRQIQAALRTGRGASRASPAGFAAEALTNRERDVLELLELRLRDKEIAQKLGVSPETVKTHLKSLYQKLDCVGRRQTVERARQLELLR